MCAGKRGGELQVMTAAAGYSFPTAGFFLILECFFRFGHCCLSLISLQGGIDSGSHLISRHMGAHGHHGTNALTGSRSMAATSARHPVSVSIMNGVLATLSFISERMKPG